MLCEGERQAEEASAQNGRGLCYLYFLLSEMQGRAEVDQKSGIVWRALIDGIRAAVGLNVQCYVL